jgi:hypothetical protein
MIFRNSFVGGLIFNNKQFGTFILLSDIYKLNSPYILILWMLYIKVEDKIFK